MMFDLTIAFIKSKNIPMLQTRPTGLLDATSVPLILINCKARWNSMFYRKPVLIAKHGEIPWLIAKYGEIHWFIVKYGEIP